MTSSSAVSSADSFRPVWSWSKLSKLVSSHSRSAACVDGDLRAQQVLLGQALREMGHPAGPVLLDPRDGPAHRVGVELGHREQGPEHVAVGGEHPHPAGDPAAQVLARVRIRDGVHDLLEPGPLPPQVLGERVEQPRARAEDEIDGGPGDAGGAGDLLDADRGGRSVVQPLVDRVQDAPPGLLRRLRAQALLVLAGGHGPTLTFHLTSRLVKYTLSDEKTECPMNFRGEPRWGVRWTPGRNGPAAGC